MDKKINLVECSGRITYKRYDEERGQFFFVLYIAVPRTTRRRNESRTDVVRDAPGFVYNGSDAKELCDKFKVNDNITVIGHADTEQSYQPQGGRMFKSVYQTSLIADSILPGHGLAYDNTAILSGEIVYVYRNADPGKRFYIVTVDTEGANKDPVRTSFTYFDQGMRLEPQKGEYVHGFGVVQVKHETDDASGRDRILTTIVARTVGLEKEETEANATPRQDTASGRNRVRTIHHENIQQPPKEEENVVMAEDVETEGWEDAE